MKRILCLSVSSADYGLTRTILRVIDTHTDLHSVLLSSLCIWRRKRVTLAN